MTQYVPAPEQFEGARYDGIGPKIGLTPCCRCPRASLWKFLGSFGVHAPSIRADPECLGNDMKLLRIAHRKLLQQRDQRRVGIRHSRYSRLQHAR
jgi:hypothetical protein